MKTRFPLNIHFDQISSFSSTATALTWLVIRFSLTQHCQRGDDPTDAMRCWPNDGPASETPARRLPSIPSTARVCRRQRIHQSNLIWSNMTDYEMGSVGCALFPRETHRTLALRWSNAGPDVADGDPTLNQHRANVSC